MTQSSLPTWVPILIGGGGVAAILTVLLNLYKESKTLKDDYTNSLKDRINDLRLQQNDLRLRQEEKIEDIERKHRREIDSLYRDLDSKKQELAELGDLRDLHKNIIEVFSSQEKTPEARKLLSRLENLLANFEQSREIRKSTRTASEWLNYKRESWTDKAVAGAARRYPDILTTENSELFESDMQKYMDWLYDSLRLSFTCRMEDYVKTRSIDSPFPYRAAFQELAEINDFGQLLDSEVKDLQDYIGELSRRALD